MTKEKLGMLWEFSTYNAFLLHSGRNHEDLSEVEQNQTYQN